MTPGTVFSYQNFKFHDGNFGNKILITLGVAKGVNLVVKTTSQGSRYNAIFGCQLNERFPNFHLVQNCCILQKPTWVCLDEFYELIDREVLRYHFSGHVKPIGNLPKEITVALIECALKSDDISDYQEGIIRSSSNST
jgi:hypothetical protein